MTIAARSRAESVLMITPSPASRCSLIAFTRCFGRSERRGVATGALFGTRGWHTPVNQVAAARSGGTGSRLRTGRSERIRYIHRESRALRPLVSVETTEMFGPVMRRARWHSTIPSHGGELPARRSARRRDQPQRGGRRNTRVILAAPVGKRYLSINARQPGAGSRTGGAGQAVSIANPCALAPFSPVHTTAFCPAMRGDHDRTQARRSRAGQRPGRGHAGTGAHGGQRVVRPGVDRRRGRHELVGRPELARHVG